MKIGISYDHNGYEVGQQLKKYLTNKGYEVKDYNNVYNKITKRGIYSWQKRLVQ